MCRCLAWMSSNQLILPNWLMLFAVDGLKGSQKCTLSLVLSAVAPLHASQTGLGIEPQTLIVNSWPVTT